MKALPSLSAATDDHLDPHHELQAKACYTHTEQIHVVKHNAETWLAWVVVVPSEARQDTKLSMRRSILIFFVNEKDKYFNRRGRGTSLVGQVVRVRAYRNKSVVLWIACDK